MCSQYTLKADRNQILEKLDVKDQESKPYDFRAHGYLKTDLAPVVVEMDGDIQIREMHFSLCPSWSKEFPYKWSSYNARLERPNPKKPSETEFIYQVPTWRDAFNKGKTCLVPMTSAIESSYFGTHAGRIVSFSVKDKDFFFCAGLWSEWIDKSTGEIKETFTLLTDDPYRFFFETGHDRSVIVLESDAHKKWLTDKKLTPKERFDFIRTKRANPSWDVATDREMAKGWEKRAPSPADLQSIKIWSPI